MIVDAVKTRILEEGEDLVKFITEHIKKVSENTVIVVTSKIVALSERRTVEMKNPGDKAELIKKESEFAVATKHVWLTLKDGVMMASAGIDESNAKGKLVLLPENSFRSAENLRKKLQKFYNVKNLGVLITDSRTMPLRAGVIGAALGYSGFEGVRDYRGKPDIYGRKFVFSRTNVADSLATSAVLLMGEGDEKQPLAIVKNAPIVFTNKTDPKELQVNIEDDMYHPLFSSLPKKK